MRAFLNDLRYALRQLRHAKAFTSIAVLTLGIGIGVTTAFFAIEDAAIFRPARLARLEHLYSLFVRDRRIAPAMWVTESQFRALEAHPPPGIERVASIDSWTTIAKIPGRTEQLNQAIVTGGVGSMFTVPMQAGRFLGPDDDRAEAAPVVVISDAIWRQWFGARNDVAGRATITLDSTRPYTVVGVAAAGVDGVFPFSRADIWIPAARQPDRSGFPAAFRSIFGLALVRIRPGTPLDQAESGIKQVLEASPGGLEPLITGKPYNKSVDASAARVEMNSVRIGDQSLAITMLFLSVFVLLAACANLANMLYARGAQRLGEIAVRLSLGASAGQIFRLFFLEAGVIAALGSGLGLLLALSATRLTGVASPFTRIGREGDMLDLSPDYRVYLYAVGCGALAALLVGGMSAWRASRVAPLRVLASAGAAGGITPRRGFARAAFVAIQVSAALILVMAAGVYVARTAQVLDRHLLFDTAPLASARLNLSRFYRQKYTESSTRAFFDRVLRDTAKLPDVQSATLTSGLPGASYAPVRQLLVADKDSSLIDGDSPTPWRDSTYRRVNVYLSTGSVDFLKTIGLPLTRGRDFRSTDVDGAPLVAIVSESAAARLWPGRDPLGRRAMLGLETHWLTVVGVCADAISEWVESDIDSPSNFVLVPFDQRFSTDALVVARTSKPGAAAGAIRAAVHAIDEDVPVSDAGTVDAAILAWVRPLRAWGALMASLVVISLCIASLGIYGVISYFVSLRTREFGIRLALGATPRQLVLMTVREARLLLLIGLLPGVWIVSVGSRFFQNTTLKVFTPNDIPTWFAVPALILAVGLIAAYIPARRAARVDPNVALREL